MITSTDLDILECMLEYQKNGTPVVPAKLNSTEIITSFRKCEFYNIYKQSYGKKKEITIKGRWILFRYRMRFKCK